MILTLGERTALLPGVSARRIVHEVAWLSVELLETEIARERFQAWARGGGLDRNPPPIHDAVAFHGDVPMLDIVVDAIRCTPPPVRDHIVDVVTIFGVGWTTNGWAAGALTPRPQTIALSGASRDAEEVLRIALHEMAHAWLEPFAKEAALAAAAEDHDHAVEDVLQLADEEGWPPDLVRCYRRSVDRPERQACALAAEWAARAAERKS